MSSIRAASHGRRGRYGWPLLSGALAGASIALLVVARPGAVAGTARALALPVATAFAAARPRPPLIVGAETHLGIGGDYGYDVERTRWALGAMRLGSFRDDLPWPDFKTAGPNAPGRVPPRLAQLMAATSARPLLIVGFPHPAVDGGHAPLSPHAISAFATFAGDAAAATRQQHPIFELWNEWNRTAGGANEPIIGAGVPSDARAAVHYAALAHAAAAAIRAADPSATILIGASGTDVSWRWTRGVARTGALTGADGLSVHFYNHCERDSARRSGAGAIAAIEELHRMLVADGARTVPLYITEVGWPTTRGGSCDIGPERAADNLAQLLLWAAATPWIKGVWIYELKDQGQQAAEVEDNFGLFGYDYTPKKPLACSVQDATALIGSTTAWHVEHPRPGVTLLFLRGTSTGRGTAQIVAWRDGDAPATLSAGGAALHYRAFCAPAATETPSVALSPRPVIIDAGPLLAARRTVVVR